MAIYDECSRILYEEIDYRMEASYAQEFAANFAGVSWVKVPSIDTSLLAANVLVMEYVPGLLPPSHVTISVCAVLLVLVAGFVSPCMVATSKCRFVQDPTHACTAGVKINDADAIDAMGLDRDRLARLSVESYLQQLLRYGLFHADPHPGNVACDSVDGGRLIYYDFGMMGRIQPFVR